MFFVMSKLFWLIFAPLTFITLLICVGGALRRLRAGRMLCGTGIVLLALLGFLPIGHDMLATLENKFPEMANFPKKVDGIIVLGGAIELRTSVARHQVQLNENAPRITEMIYLAKLYPDAKIVFTGGDGNLSKTSSNESIELYNLLKDIGFNPSRILFEGESRNTFENMQFSKDLVKPKEGETWILVTSAYHMPRSYAIFTSNGWNVLPYTAGYFTDGTLRFTPNLEVLGNMYKFQVAAKEIIGIMAYTLTGKIKTHDTISIPSGVSGDLSFSPSGPSGK
jgi:uncharacterized SAM-binding protein YcdF (DUF218 family)